MRRKTGLWVVLSAIALVIPVTAAVFFGMRLPADVGEGELVGVWRADGSDGRIVLEADGTARLDDVVLPPLLEGQVSGIAGEVEWTWRLDRHAVRLRLQDATADRIGGFDLDAVTCAIDVCLRYGVDESSIVFRDRQS